MTELEEQLRRLAERADVRGPSAVFDAASEQDPPRTGIRSARALVLVAVVVIAVVSVTAGLLVRADGPRSITADVPPFADGALPFDTDTVLLYDDGLEGVVAVDVDGRRVRTHALDGQRAGDQPFRLHRAGDALVFGWGEVFASTLTGTDVRSLGAATIFVPAVEEGSVWLVDYPGGRIGDGIPNLRRVTTDGEVVETSGGLRQDEAFPIREVDGGMAYQTEDGVVVWDPETNETSEPFPGATTIGDVRGTLVAWCATTPCTALHITDLETGDDVEVEATDPAYAVNVPDARFSPDGSVLVVQTGPEILLIDTASGRRQVAVTDALPDAGHLVWTDDGRRVFFSSVSYGTGTMRLGAYDRESEEAATRLLPFGGTLGFVAVPDTVGLVLFDAEAARFEPCEPDAGTCPTTTTTTTVPATNPSSPPNS